MLGQLITNFQSGLQNLPCWTVRKEKITLLILNETIQLKVLQESKWGRETLWYSAKVHSIIHGWNQAPQTYHWGFLSLNFVLLHASFSFSTGWLTRSFRSTWDHLQRQQKEILGSENSKQNRGIHGLVGSHAYTWMNLCGQRKRNTAQLNLDLGPVLALGQYLAHTEHH